MLYISGPMTGLPNFNRDTFVEVTKQFRDEGMEVMSSHELTLGDQDPSQPWDFYMRGAVKMLMDCDQIALLPGWRNSKGARRELDLAIDLGMEVFTLQVVVQNMADGGNYWQMDPIL